MAGSGRRVFTPGEVLSASNVMNYLQDQAVMNFAGTAARGSAIGTAVSEGMVSYLQDNNFVQVHDGTAWRSVGGVQAVSGTAVRAALFPSPIQGDSVFRTDTGWIETYYGLYNASTNPGGVSVAGWYPVSGNMPQAKLVRNTTVFTFTNAAWNTVPNLTYWATEIPAFGGVTIETNGTLKTSLPGIYEVSMGIMSGGISFAIHSVKKNNMGADGVSQIGVQTARGESGWTGSSVKSTIKLAANDYIFWSYYVNGTSSSYAWNNSDERGASFMHLRYVGPPLGA